MRGSPVVLLDENIPRPLVAALSAEGIAVVHAATVAAGESDEHLLAWAARERWILVTSDLDFPRLIYAENHGTPLTLVVERRAPCNVPLLASDILRILKLGERLHGHVVVLEHDDERVRAFPWRSSGD
jgi:predicted nuclease of predicted toxin-antitoxin system